MTGARVKLEEESDWGILQCSAGSGVIAYCAHAVHRELQA
jgi:hypothetical protein